MNLFFYLAQHKDHLFSTILLLYKVDIKRIKYHHIDRAERHNLKSRFLLFILLLFFSLLLGGVRKRKKNNQSRDFKSCFSARSISKDFTLNLG